MVKNSSTNAGPRMKEPCNYITYIALDVVDNNFSGGSNFELCVCLDAFD